MRSTIFDNSALKQQLQQQQTNSSLCIPLCDSQSSCCSSPLSARQLSCLEAKNASNSTTTKAATTTRHILPHQIHHLLQRYHMFLPLIQRSAISPVNCLWLRSSQMLPRHKLQPAGYQQSSAATSKAKNATTTQHIVINISSSQTRRLHTNISNKRCLTRSPSLVLLTLLLLWLSHLIGNACAAPQSCVLCDINDFNDQASNGHAYEEYHFEHQVSRVDAVTALKAFNASNYGEPSSCAISCSEKVMKYCLGPQFINDHCWCELGHTEEGLPFVPHVCYVGEKHYKAAVGSCYFYEQVKECCCAPALAKQWHHISAAARHTNASCLLLLTTISSLVFNAARRHKNSGLN